MVLSKIVVLKSAWRRAVDFSLNIGYENYEDKINDFFFLHVAGPAGDWITKN